MTETWHAGNGPGGEAYEFATKFGGWVKARRVASSPSVQTLVWKADAVPADGAAEASWWEAIQ